MSSNPVKRKLAAILAADAVGYSRMMAADEEGTLRILSAHRAVIDGIIEFHEGRIVNTAGDSVLAEFASPVTAVRCAVEIQDALKTRNDALPEAQRMQFRIGVNLGDVMVKGDDLLGDGVNVAARLEGIAQPGQICLSSSIYDQIVGKLDLGFVDLGDQSLKNIDRPVRAYRVERGAGRPQAARTGKPPHAGRAWMLAGLAAIIAAGAGMWQLQRGTVPAAPESEARAKALTEEDARRAALAQAELARKTREAQNARLEAERERREAKAAAAKARAEADEARRRADAAEAKARAEAELARARSEVQALRLKAQAELEAAERTRRTAEQGSREKEAPIVARVAPAAPVPASTSAYRGRWSAVLSCPQQARMPPLESAVEVVVDADGFDVQIGSKDQPGSVSLHGVPRADGRLRLAGSGRSALPRFYGKPFPAAIDGRISTERYEGRGNIGARTCQFVMERNAPQR